MVRRSALLLVCTLATALGLAAMGPTAAAAPKEAARKPAPSSKNGKTSKAASRGAAAKRKAKGKEGGAHAAKADPPPMVGGRVAVFVFKGEDASAPVRTQVVNLLRNKGLNVTTTLLPVDSADQYRDMAATLGLAVYVHGEVRDNGERAKAVVHIRSGVTGRKIKSVRFAAASAELPDDVGKSLWGEVGPAFVRTCAAAAKPRKTGRAPLRIEAGTPLEPTDT